MSPHTLLPTGLKAPESLFQSQLPLTFLVGAGISMDPPSNLPSAREIVSTLLECYAVPSEVNKLVALPSLRYEQVVDEIQRYCDPQLTFVDYLMEIQHPNVLHLALAEQLVKGQFVITTNFDALIEHGLRAILPPEQHDSIVPVITKADFERYADPGALLQPTKSGMKKQYPIYKLHGAPRNVITGEETRASLVSTISALGKGREQGETFAIEKFKKPAVSALLAGRILVITGYSGRDDFDITPVLESYPNLAGVVWVEHDPSRTPFTFVEVPGSPPSVGFSVPQGNERVLQFLRSMRRRHGYPIYYLQGKSADVVRAWLRPREPSAKGGTALSFSDWMRSHLKTVTDYSKHQLTTVLYRITANNDDETRIGAAGLKLAGAQHDSRAISWFADAYGSCFLDRWDFTTALKYFEEALQHADLAGDLGGKAKTLCNIGMAHHRKGEYDAALKYYQDALVLEDLMGNLNAKTAELSNIGSIYYAKGDNAAALKYYQDAIKIVEETGDLGAKADFLGNMSVIYAKNGDYDACFRHYQDALRIVDQLGQIARKASFSSSIGDIYKAKGDFANALSCYRDSLKIHEQLENLGGKAYDLELIAEVLHGQGDHDLAFSSITEACVLYQHLKMKGEARHVQTTLQEWKVPEIWYFQNAARIAGDLGNYKLKGDLLLSLGLFSYRKNEYAPALAAFKDALETAKYSSDKITRPLLLEFIAECLLNLGQRDQAIPLLEEAWTLNKPIGNGAAIARVRELFVKWKIPIPGEPR